MTWSLALKVKKNCRSPCMPSLNGQTNELKINEEKIVQMIYRKGSRIPSNNNVHHNDDTLEIVNSFKGSIT
jgi:hypothetical protein